MNTTLLDMTSREFNIFLDGKIDKFIVNNYHDIHQTECSGSQFTHIHLCTDAGSPTQRCATPTLEKQYLSFSPPR